NCWTVGQRIAEGNTQLDYVGAGLHQRLDDWGRTLDGRESYRDVRHQRDPAGLAECLKSGCNSTHSVTPNASATVSISLSPRPLTLTTRISSVLIFGARL